MAGSRIKSLSALLALTLCLAGCTSQHPSDPSGSNTRSIPAQRGQGSAAAPSSQAGSVGKPYDFYLLTLSWSPEYCVTNPGAVECSQHLGFVVHGLWPQNFDGSYPKNCPTRPATLTDAEWQGLFPTASLAQHEWTAHGACTPYDAATYFGLVRKARGEVQIPSAFTAPTQLPSDTPGDLIAQFARINTGIPPGGIALNCGNNALTSVEFCFDKNLKPIACQAVRSCRANSVKIPSIGAQ
jgi:ribonuclease T2